MTRLVATKQDAVDFLDERIGSGVQPGLERISGLMALMGDPHLAVPTIHVAGTNGKTTTVRLIRDLVLAHGLSVGTFVSPHLHSVEERFTINGEVISERAFVDVMASLAAFVEIYEQRHATTVTYFEATAAFAFALFETEAVDVAVVEVGLGGRLDATNIVAAEVSVITGIAMDHMAYLGTTIGAIAGEKAAILKEGGTLVTGPLPAAAEGPVTAQVVATGSKWHMAGGDFSVTEAVLAVGGWHISISGLHADYEDLYLPLHGRHQVQHFATAVAAVEALFGRSLDPDAVRTAAAGATSPGRIEVVQRNPLVILDGAHNAEGLQGLAEALATEFPETRRVLVVGFRGERDVPHLLEALDGLFDEVVVTAADDADAVDVGSVADGVRQAFGAEVTVVVEQPVAQAVTEALHRVAEDEILVVTGSLYVVGEARQALQRS